VLAFAEEIGLAWEAPPELPVLDTHDKQRLIAFSQIAARGRSTVIRDPYSHDVVERSVGEYPIRLGRQFGQLLRALRYIGVDDDDAWRIIRKCSFDSMPGTRRTVLMSLFRGAAHMPEIAGITNIGQSTVRRSLEELKIHRLVDHAESYWEVSEWTKDRLREALNGTRAKSLEEASGW
jgi:hypothetical protein